MPVMEQAIGGERKMEKEKRRRPPNARLRNKVVQGNRRAREVDRSSLEFHKCERKRQSVMVHWYNDDRPERRCR